MAPNIFQKTWSAIMNATTAFRETFLSTGAIEAEDFVSASARALRYNIFWSLYEGSAYSKIHNWSSKLKSDYGLYKFIRNIYNPTYRLIDFWQTHLMGGTLDPAAGDGKAVPSCLPIITDDEQLRGAIAAAWKASGWQVNKDIFTLRGALMGDVAIKIVDDVPGKRVFMDVVHPGIIKSVLLDAQGNVKAYEFEEERADPRPNSTRKVTYTERAWRDGDGSLTVHFETLLDNAPFAWNGNQGAQWEEQYGFVPLVMVQHNNVGLRFGWSELQPGLGKFRELDDQASLLNDQIRKTVNPIPVLFGVPNPATTPNPASKGAAAQNPNAPGEPGRQELPAIYAPLGGSIDYLVAPLNIAETLANIKSLLEEIERDYPELKMDIWQAGGDTSGTALRIARQRTETKVYQRRPNYDDGLKRAQQMAVAIGGMKSYNGYQGFGLDSYSTGALDHTIGNRPVFAVDIFSQLEQTKLFWEVAEAVKTTGGPAGLAIWLLQQGWSNEDVQKVITPNADMNGVPTYP